MNTSLAVQLQQKLTAVGGRNWHHILLAAGCALVISLLVTSYWQYSQSVNALHSLKASRDRVDHLDSLLIALLDAETGVRGYLLTGREGYLHPYREALPRVTESLALIRKDADDGYLPQQAVIALQSMVERKLEVLDRARERNAVTIVPETGVGEGKRVMDDIRNVLTELKREAWGRSESLIGASTNSLQLTRWTTIALGAGALLLLVALFAVVVRHNALQVRIRQLLTTENQRLETEVTRRTAELAGMAEYLSNVREAEKSRLARELHDELGAILTSAKMDTSWIARKIDADTMSQIRERFERLVKQLNNGIALKRRIIDNLRPPLLEELGLIASLQAMVDEVRGATGMQVRFDAPEKDPALSGDKILALYRITQESVTNVRKYAQARSLHIELTQAGGRVRLTVSDDGTGFDTASLTATHGVAGMRYRVRTFGGHFELRSAPGQGTTVVAEIPGG